MEKFVDRSFFFSKNWISSSKSKSSVRYWSVNSCIWFFYENFEHNHWRNSLMRHTWCEHLVYRLEFHYRSHSSNGFTWSRTTIDKERVIHPPRDLVATAMAAPRRVMRLPSPWTKFWKVYLWFRPFFISEVTNLFVSWSSDVSATLSAFS